MGKGKMKFIFLAFTALFPFAVKRFMYEALATLLESSKVREEMGKKGREYILKHYTISQQVEKIVIIFQKTLKTIREKLN